MAQELDVIIDLLREVKRANESQSANFDRLLADINNKVNDLEKGTASAELLKSYLTDMVKSFEIKYSSTVEKFTDIENALKAIYNSQDEHVKNKDMRELFDIFTKNLNNFYTESLHQKSLLTSIESRISEINANKSDKDEIIRTITLLRSDFENLNYGLKNIIDSVSSDLKSIISSLVKIDQSAVSAQIQEQIDNMYKAISDIANFLKAIDKHETNLESLLMNAATSESLEITQLAVDKIIKKSEDISQQLSMLATSSQTQDLIESTKQLSDRLDDLAKERQAGEISKKADEITEVANDIKKTLAKITKHIDKLPDTATLKEALQYLYNQLKEIEDAIIGTGVKANVIELENKFSTFVSDLETIKSIISDLKESVDIKIQNISDSISFEKESYEIKTYISQMLAQLPQKDDIEKILENGNLGITSLYDLHSKTDKLVKSIDDLPTQKDLETISDNQQAIREDLHYMASKEDIENLSSKSDDIEKMIDNLNFDKEFGRIYDKSSSLEKWLVDSRIKENSEEIITKLDECTDNKHIMNILHLAEEIAASLDELSQNSDVKKVNRTVSDIYQLIEDLKTDFINTTEMHNDSVIVNLSELQRHIENIVTGDEFDNFVEDLKNFVETSVKSSNEASKNIDEIKEFQKSILKKLDNIDTSNIPKDLSQHLDEFDSKLTTLTEFLNNNKVTDVVELKKMISEVKEILQNKKSNISEIEDQNINIIKTIEDYIKEIRVILDTNDSRSNENVSSLIADLEDKLSAYQSDNENLLNELIDKVDIYKNELDSNDNSVKISKDEIIAIKDSLQDLSKSFKDLNFVKDSKESETANFVHGRLDDICQNLEVLNSDISSGLQTGFTYNSQLIEEKTQILSALIKELRHDNTQNIDLYERLTVTDNKLMDVKQELSLINTDVVSNLNSRFEQLLTELEPVKYLVLKVAEALKSDNKTSLKIDLNNIHESVVDDLQEITKYSKSTFEKLENSYKQICANLENNLRDFILSDIDSVIIKIDSLKTELEKGIGKVVPPNAENMEELKSFTNEINDFKTYQKDLIEGAAEDIKASVSSQLDKQHEELKSLLTVAINNKEIIEAIEDLKMVFSSRVKDLDENYDEIFEDFAQNNYEEEFKSNKNQKIIEEIKQDFDKFSKVITELSDQNSEISEILNVMREKMDSISVSVPSTDTSGEPEIVEEDENSDQGDNSDNNLNSKIVVGSGNFDFVKALNLLKQDIKSLHKDISKVIPQEEQEKASTGMKSIPSLGNSNLLVALNNKVELLTKIIKPDQWLDDIKSYLATSEIHTMLEEISSKIDILSLSDNTQWLQDIKQALDQLNQDNENEKINPQIQSMLNLINQKLDIIASTDDYDLMEELRDALDNISYESGEETQNLIKALNAKVDILASTDSIDEFDNIKEILEGIETKLDKVGKGEQESSKLQDTLSSIDAKMDIIANFGDNTSDFDDIKYTLQNVDEKVDSVRKMSESDAKMTSMLEDLNQKVDKIADVNDLPMATLSEIQDIKDLIMAQTDYIGSFEKNNKTDAVRKCLKELTEEVNNLNSPNNTKAIQKTIREMKESIMGAVITIFDQVSFTEESEDIKDFVEEKTDEINKNLTAVTNQLKQITNFTDSQDYTYSMQDIESDLAKMRIALSELQANEQENQAVNLTSILDNISQIGASVENLQNSLTQEEVFSLKNKFEKINQDITGLSNITNELVEKSGESYKVIANKLTKKVDNVAGLLEKSNASDAVMRQALIYMGEWIDSASESINKISNNSEEISDIKAVLEGLKKSIPTQTELLNSLGEKFDEQQERLAYFEKQINKISSIQDRFEEQQERIDRLEMALEKILSAVEDIDDSKVTRKIDKIDKQIAKLSTNIEKLASYVD